jgi:hypothetical protein
MSLAVFIGVVPYSYLLAQTKPEPEWTLNQQKTAVTVKIPSVPPATVTLDAAQVEKMIQMFAQMRVVMTPPRPMASPAPGTTINVATAGRWYVQPDGTGVDLAILHPGYGWVGLQLDPDAMEQLSRRLSRPTHRTAIRARHSSERK